uniref:Xylulose kinase-1 n=1 Tax=Tanacetum cinerariifolium TaxID=118510 RepID=A0A6L2MY76_TANCI|nr:hypothetical protein [Tanacetum cinerariifolium]
MALTFTDTHSMIAFLTKSDASEGFNQIIDFLNASSIKYALTVNPNIYVSCIKQFWTSVAMKKVNDVARLQALVDKKRVIITEATIRDAFRLDDAEGVKCLPNKEIFAELARMRYEKPSTKLTFYKAFFSSQWKLLIHTILQCMSAKRTSGNEFSSSMTSAVIYLSTGKGCSGVETPLFERMIVEQLVGEGVDEVHDEGVPTAGVAIEGDASAIDDEVPGVVDEPSIPSPPPPTQPPPPSQDLPSTSQVQPTPPPSLIAQDKIAQALEIKKLKQRVKKLERRNKASKLRRLKRVGTTQRVETFNDTIMDDVSKQERIITDMDANVDVTLKDVATVAKDVQDAEIEESLDVQGRKAESQAQIYQIDLEHADKLITKVVTAASATITAAALQLTTAADPTLTTAPSAARRRNGVVIRDLEESTTPSTIIHSEAKSKDKGKGILAELNKNIDWDDVINHVQRKEKEDNAVKRYQALKRKPQNEAQAWKNIMIYLRNTKEQMEEEDIRALKRLSESQEDRAAKKQKLDEKVAELKRHL